MHKQDQIFLANGAWEDLESEVAFDSGSEVHVVPLRWPGTRAAGFVLESTQPAGLNGRPNVAQKQLNLFDPDLSSDMQSIFQIANVTRPLMAVGKVRDEGEEITLNQVMVVVRNKDEDELRKFNSFLGD